MKDLETTSGKYLMSWVCVCIELIFFIETSGFPEPCKGFRHLTDVA